MTDEAVYRTAPATPGLLNNFLSNKKSGSTPLEYGLGAKKPVLAMFALEPHVWGLNYVHMSSYFPHI